MLFTKDSLDAHSKVDAVPSLQEESLTEEPGVGDEHQAQVIALARAIHETGMGGLASIALHTLKPLHWLGGQALWALQPFVEALGISSRRGSSLLQIQNLARLLEREGAVEEVAAHLDILQQHRSGLREEPDKR